ncbi:hypothetical protein QQY66_35935 [Streptomyces sp. DG2A-72]|uniref:hypothetical protein n=1 Tax=Streptomyces sp. DG2A-72 TaxID=3051386 RepID=UPI00265BEE77|nr:hypothetical protein [Streptomyces sp. DG2A-72]MDO0936846.1 hypothetical protein [Streptomyces sp. DG2A-72]
MTTAPPTPPDTDAAAFVAALRRLKAWSGLSYRRLESRAADAGHALPYSTAATMLGRERLPRAELVAAFVAACGVRGAEAEAWADARSRIACGAADAGSPAGRAGVGGGSPAGCAGVGGGSLAGRAAVVTSPAWSGPREAVPVRRPRPRRWAPVAAAVLLTALLGGALASGGLTDDEEIRQSRTAYDVIEAR